MRFVSLILLLISACVAFAQKPDTVLVTSTGKNFTVSDLSPDAQKLYEGPNSVIAETREQLLKFFVNERLVEADAAARGVSSESLEEAEKAKIPSPAET